MRQPPFRVGKGVDLAATLRPELRQHADRAAYFLDLLRRKTKVDCQAIRLMSKHLGNMMGRTIYTAIIEDLERAGLVTRSRSYRPGERSKAYALTRAYLALEKVDYRPTNRYLLSNLRKFFAECRERSGRAAFDPVLEFLYSQVLRVSLDDALVNAVIDREADAERRYRIKSVSSQIRLGDFGVHEDRQGRVYHPVAFLPREIRRSATVDGEALCEIDIVNSQPLLLPVVYRLWRESGRRFARMEVGGIEKSSYASALDIPVISPYQCSQVEEIAEFQSWCEGGELYERLAEIAGWEIGDELSRGDVKRRVFRQLLYADASGLWRPDNTLAIAFRERFPKLFDMICDAQQKTLVDTATRKRVKSRSSAPSGRASLVKKSVLPFYMQRIESQLIVRGVVPRWMTEKPGRFIATIHDSLLVAESDAEDAAQMLRDEFAAVGLYPQVKVSKGLVTA